MFVIIIMYASFSYILQVSVEMHLQCGGIYNNYADCASERILKIGQ